MKNIILFFNQHTVLSITWISLLILTLFIVLKRLTSKIVIVTCEEAIRLINRENGIVLDLRHHHDFYEGHIINSINLTPNEISSNIKKLNKHKNNPVIIVNNTEIQVKKAADYLSNSGFEKICFLKGGIARWRSENLPLIKGNSETQ